MKKISIFVTLFSKRSYHFDKTENFHYDDENFARHVFDNLKKFKDVARLAGEWPEDFEGAEIILSKFDGEHREIIAKKEF